MELKHYLRIIARRWPIIVFLPLLVGLLAVYQFAVRDATYTSHVAAVVTRHPDPQQSDEYQYDAYYNYVSSEFAIDDLVEAVNGNVFAQAVAERARAAGADVSTSEVQGALAADRRHRILHVTAGSRDQAQAETIAQAAAAELEARAFHYLGVDTAGTTAIVSIIERPEQAVRDISRLQLLILLQLLAAAGAGVLLAFFLEYLDDTLYDREAVELALRLPHLADVPAKHAP
jgi:capsular polysaccharide biosynthesis protein